MIFHQTRISGVIEVQADPAHDIRGFFARTWCREEFAEHGLSDKLVQCSVSFNHKRGTLRGLHYQAAPFPEAKLVRCTAGAIFDVAVDLRLHSPTYRQWHAAELTARNHQALYIPEGCAHGFLTLEDETEVLYQMSEFYHPESARGVRWNDPALGIVWPGAVAVITDRDQNYPDLS